MHGLSQIAIFRAQDIKTINIEMELNVLHIDKQLWEYVEFIHRIADLNFEKMNAGEEIKIKEMNKY